MLKVEGSSNLIYVNLKNKTVGRCTKALSTIFYILTKRARTLKASPHDFTKIQKLKVQLIIYFYSIVNNFPVIFLNSKIFQTLKFIYFWFLFKYKSSTNVHGLEMFFIFENRSPWPIRSIRRIGCLIRKWCFFLSFFLKRFESCSSGFLITFNWSFVWSISLALNHFCIFLGIFFGVKKLGFSCIFLALITERIRLKWELEILNDFQNFLDDFLYVNTNCWLDWKFKSYSIKTGFSNINSNMLILDEWNIPHRWWEISRFY